MCSFNFLELALPSHHPGRKGGTLEAGAEEGRDEQRGALRRAEVFSQAQSGTQSKRFTTDNYVQILSPANPFHTGTHSYLHAACHGSVLFAGSVSHIK